MPLLTLGTPGSGTTAVMLGALLGFGIQPGPRLIKLTQKILVCHNVYVYWNGNFINFKSTFDTLYCQSSCYSKNFLIPLILFFSVTGIYLMPLIILIFI